MFEVGWKGINLSNSGDINLVFWGFKICIIKVCKYVKICLYVDNKVELGLRVKINLNFDSLKYCSKL